MVRLVEATKLSPTQSYANDDGSLLDQEEIEEDITTILRFRAHHHQATSDDEYGIASRIICNASSQDNSMSSSLPSSSSSSKPSSSPFP